MSPTEHDLRSALHDGEGDGVDVDRLIADGAARRAQRRVRIGSGLATVVVVAVAATAGSLLIGGNNTESGSGSSAQRKGVMSTAGARGAAPSAGTGVGAPACPTSLPRELLPGGGSPGQFGSDGPLFAQPLERMVVCAYGTSHQALDQTPPPAPGRAVLDSAQAAQLAASLEQADKTRSKICTSVRLPTALQFALIGVTADGGRLRTVTLSLATPSCQTMITNGTAIRYGWQPPAAVAAVLAQLQPAVNGVQQPSVSLKIGSPAHT